MRRKPKDKRPILTKEGNYRGGRLDSIPGGGGQTLLQDSETIRRKCLLCSGAEHGLRSPGCGDLPLPPTLHDLEQVPALDCGVSSASKGPQPFLFSQPPGSP